MDTPYNTDSMVTMVIVDTNSPDYENDSHVFSFPKDISLYGIYATTVETVKKFVNFWERNEKKEIKKKVNRIMELLNKYEL